MSKFKSVLSLLTLIALSLSFIGGDCGTNTTEPPPILVDPPKNVDLSVGAIPAEGSYALVLWDPSVDEGLTEFKGYRIVTYELNALNEIVSTFSNSLVPKNSHVAIINFIDRGTKYISYVSSELEDGTRSDSVGTKIYGGVYFNDDGIIDQYTLTTETQSGYGWDADAGIGTQYPFTTANASAIDMHLREVGGILRFYSPIKFLEGGKSTLFTDIGIGQDAFSETDLEDPVFDEIAVEDDHVYLIKTQEDNYIKVWITRIDLINNYQKVYFQYKVQPVEDLKVVKK